MLKLKWLKNERGSTAALTTLAITALIGVTALAVDVGVWYVNRVQVSNMVDAAALAGAQDLPDATKAEASAYDYANKNNKDGDTVVVQIGADNTTLTVTARREVVNLFSRVYQQLGRTTTVRATATAKIFPLGAAMGVIPIGVVKQNFVYGTTYTLKVGGGSGTTGNYGALALGGKGGSNYLDNVKFGYDGELRAGEWVTTETGNMSGPTTTGINYRIDQDANSSYNTVKEGSPRIVILPVLDSLTVNGRGEVLIVGFAAFFLEGVAGSGSKNEVTGKFMRMVIAGEAGNTGTNYGVSAVKLIE